MGMRESRIFGPPGTGKTTALVAWIGKAAPKYAGAVVVASFTRAAAKEIRARVAKAGVPINDKQVGTVRSTLTVDGRTRGRAIVRREIEPGTDVVAGGREARVVRLPFGADELDA